MNGFNYAKAIVDYAGRGLPLDYPGLTEEDRPAAEMIATILFAWASNHA